MKVGTNFFFFMLLMILPQTAITMKKNTETENKVMEAALETLGESIAERPYNLFHMTKLLGLFKAIISQTKNADLRTLVIASTSYEFERYCNKSKKSNNNQENQSLLQSHLICQIEILTSRRCGTYYKPFYKKNGLYLNHRSDKKLPTNICSLLKQIKLPISVDWEFAAYFLNTINPQKLIFCKAIYQLTKKQHSQLTQQLRKTTKNINKLQRKKPINLQSCTKNELRLFKAQNTIKHLARDPSIKLPIKTLLKSQKFCDLTVETKT